MKKIVYCLPALMFISLFLFAFIKNSPGDDRKELAVIAYYSGDNKTIDNYPVEKLTHIIYLLT